jgi:mRNA-degrading endonuclease toxin of MazEF toxin-antitoxin module
MGCCRQYSGSQGDGERAVKVECGEIWLVTLEPGVRGGVLPCMVVSNQYFNDMAIREAIVVPLTNRPRGFDHHIAVEDDGGLLGQNWAKCDSLRTVPLKRFGRRISAATEDTVESVVDQLSFWLGQRD